MPGICEDLREVLRTVQQPGDFVASGRLELPAPRLIVEGVGEISLPLPASQARQLISLAERAPYGRGTDTLVDTQVRRTWQIGAERLRLAGRRWPATVDEAATRAARMLGVEEAVSAELYKLLIYDAGSFFVEHRDSEKAAGMFGTLVLALPSASSGGELVVRHKDREVTVDLGNDDPGEMTFAAFYADCMHEVRPITAGYRATLIYNLIRRSAAKGADPETPRLPPDYEPEARKARTLLQKWTRDREEHKAAVPGKVIYPLEHAYSLAELDFAKLKGTDAAVARLLASVAPQAGCDLHLALISIRETGYATPVYTSRYRPPEEFEDLNVTERTEQLVHWRRPDGAPVELGEMAIQGEEIASDMNLKDLKPDSEQFSEATGNEGATFERLYRRAALVLWPARQRLALIRQGGVESAVSYLESLAARWVAGGQRESALWEEAHALSGQVLDAWEARTWYPDDEEDAHGGPVIRSKTGQLARLITALAGLQDRERVTAALTRLAGQPGHSLSDHPALLAGLTLLPLEEAAGMLERLAGRHAGQAPGPCCTLLSVLLQGPFAGRTDALVSTAKALKDALPGDPAQIPKDWWGKQRLPKPGHIVALVRVMEAIDADLAQRLPGQLLKWPDTYPFDGTLIPVVRQLLEEAHPRTGPAVSGLLAACVEFLEKRVAEPLERPEDWGRAGNIACTCEDCSALKQFMADPAQEDWGFKASERFRRHLEENIKAAQLDLDVRTERRGTPYTLVCRKNNASYERRMAQREQDLADLEKLKGSDRV